MKWNHLPVAGGIYDQDPAFLEGIEILFHERGVAEEEEAAREKAKSNRGMKNR